MSSINSYERKLREKLVQEASYWSLGGHICSVSSNIVTNQEEIRKKLR